MANTGDLFKGAFIKFNNELCQVMEYQHRTPGNLRAFYQVVLRNVKTGKQMEHCSRALDFSTGKTFPKRSLIGLLLGSFFKASYYNNTPWKRNTPTSPDYIIPDTPAFEQTKTRLLNLVVEFGEGGPEKCTKHPSAFFGKLTPEQHGLGQYKHLDHHLAQFGV